MTPMTSDEFNMIISTLFSAHRSPVKAAASFLGVDHSTVWRYTNGKQQIPRPVQYTLIAANLLGTDFFEPTDE
jgi:hypothetical protein